MKKAVICFYWQGDRWRSKDFDDGGKVNHLEHHLNRIGFVENNLASKYVNCLYNGVMRNTKEDVEFICFTNEKLDLADGIQVRPFTPPSLHGVLPRLYMFSEAAGLFDYQVLCLDIDVVITGSLDDLLSYKGLFCARSRFKPGKGQNMLDGDIIGFRGCKENENRFWTSFVNSKKRAESITKGRERFWFRHVVGNQPVDIWQKLFPGQLASFKRHVRGGGLDPNMRIVSFHGKPRPHQALKRETWIKNHWK